MRIMAIVPDTKNWTWVLERPCPECGFDTRGFPREDVGGLTRDCSVRWQAVLTLPGDLARRPAPDVWSPLEYGCHVRDVFRIFDLRLGLMLSQDDPRFPNWDQDETAVAERYREQDPAVVAAELAAAGEDLAAGFARVATGQWARRGYRSDGSEFTVETLARYFIHDPVHHLHDVGA
jgi:DinB superfamily